MSDSPELSQQHPSETEPTQFDTARADGLLELGLEPEASSASTPAPARNPPPTPEELQQSFAQYEILSLLGWGGMGAVYKARQKALDRLVAIKLLPPALSGDAEFAARFEREARAMARLNHPNIVTVHDSGRTEEGRLYFVMEFVDGTNLAELIRSGSLDSAQVLSITAQICDALAYAHGEGVVHRDIKPANVMVDRHGRVKVADFGIARLIGLELDPGFTTTGTVLGTIDYMAPEQRMGMRVDHRADIFSLGVMLYEMFCREVPRGVFPPPSQRSGCDVRIDEIVHYAMQQERELRYQSTQEVKTAVETVRTTVVRPPKPSGRKSRRRLVVAGAVALVLAPLGFAVFGPLGKMRALKAKNALPSVTVPTAAPLDPEAQVRRVLVKLKELNPGFVASTASWRVENDRIVELTLNITALTDLSPVRTLTSLKRLRLGQTSQTGGVLESLSGLRGLSLEWLECHNSGISDLSPLRGMPLKWFVCQGSHVSDLRPLTACPLQALGINGTDVTTLDALRGLPLKFLNLGVTEVTDLTPLRGMPLTDLNCSRTRVRDLGPVTGMALTRLICSQTLIEDLSLLRGMPLKELDCDFVAARDAEILRSISTLEKINGLPAAEFWMRTR